MTKSLLFWVILLLWLVVGMWKSNWEWKGSAPNFILFVLLALLGWVTFGPAIK